MMLVALPLLAVILPCVWGRILLIETKNEQQHHHHHPASQPGKTKTTVGKLIKVSSPDLIRQLFWQIDYYYLNFAKELIFIQRQAFCQCYF